MVAHRIALVSAEYPPFGGGIGTYTQVLAKVLTQFGTEVHVITNHWCPDPHEHLQIVVRQQEGITVHRLPVLDTNFRSHLPGDHPLATVERDWEASLSWSLHAAEYLQQLQTLSAFDVCEFPECFAEAYVTLQRRKLGMFVDLPVVLTLHTPVWEHHFYNGLPLVYPSVRRRVQMEDFCIQYADALNSPSASLRDLVYTRLGLDSETLPCPVIRYPMDFDHVAVHGAPLYAEPHLFFAGRIEPRKGVELLVQAAARAMETESRLRVRLVGRDSQAGFVPGSMTEVLKARIPDRWRSNFEFAGPMPRRELFAQYRNATASLFPCTWDNFPYTLCEAMAAGARVVVGSGSGPAEIVEHDISGVVVPRGDEEALRKVILDLIAADSGSAMRSAAQRRIQSLCDPKTVVRQKLELYAHAVIQRDQARSAA